MNSIKKIVGIDSQKQSIEILFKFLDELNQDIKLTGSDLFDFLLWQVTDFEQVLSDLSWIFNQCLFNVILFLKFWLFRWLRLNPFGGIPFLSDMMIFGLWLMLDWLLKDPDMLLILFDLILEFAGFLAVLIVLFW